MKDWFLALEARERKLVAGGAGILGLLLIYVVIWEPIVGSYFDLKHSVAEQKKDLVWMKQASQELKVLQGSSRSAARGLGGRSLLSVVDQSARSGGLGEAIKRIEPDGTRGVKVWLESAAFDPMIVWLGSVLKTYSIQTSMITIEPLGGGLVNARITLLEPGA